jgi:hypothetical protein
MTILAALALGPLLTTTVHAATVSQSANHVFLGLSGYPTSTTNIDNIIKTMNNNDLNTYRMSANPEWFSSKPHSYHSNYVQYFLDHSDFTIVVDRNHIYPPTEAGAQTARNNWATVRNSIFEVLKAYPNNQRVMVELVNEYVSSDFYSRMQSLVNEIRAAGYTNPILVNKWNQAWTKINDPLDNTYQGYHFYFNSWSPSGAISQMNTALSKGIKIINTEVGADYREKSYFTTSTVGELETFMTQCASRGIGNTVWMNENLGNWQTYQTLSLNFPAVTSPSPTPGSTPNPTPNPTPAPTSPTTTTTFEDGFESNSLNNWDSITKTSGETVTVSSSRPHDGKYHAIFTTAGSYNTRENAYLSEEVDMQEVFASGYFRITSQSSSQILSNDGDKFYLIQINSNSDYIALAGVKRENGVNKWLLYADGTKTSSAETVSTDQWYNVELHWNPATSTAELYVDGEKILTSTIGNDSEVTSVDMGIISTYNVQNRLQVYGDCFTISNRYVTLE